MKFITVILLNVFFFILLLFGFVMAGDTVAGWIVMAIPLTFWIMKFLIKIHKNMWAALFFWGAFACVQWQISLTVFIAFLFFRMFKSFIRLIDFNGTTHEEFSLHDKIVNDAYEEGMHLEDESIIKDETFF